MPKISVRQTMPPPPQPSLSLLQDAFGISPQCRSEEALSLWKRLIILQGLEGASKRPNIALALSLLSFCQLAYTDPGQGLRQKVERESHALGGDTTGSSCSGFQLVNFHRDRGLLHDTELFVAVNGHGEIVVAFRGSETDSFGLLQDLIGTNARTIIRRRYERRKGSIKKPNKIHRGFYHAYRQIAGHLEKILRQALKSRAVRNGVNPRIYITGHSLGGALATIAGMDLAVQQDDGNFPRIPITVYTYGAPRALNHNCLRSVFHPLLPNAFAFINDKDRIPRLPRVLLGMYGNGRRLTQIENIVVLKSTGLYDVKSGDNFKRTKPRGSSIKGQHSAGDYRKRLEKAIGIL